MPFSSGDNDDKVVGADGTIIGNVGDRLKVDIQDITVNVGDRNTDLFDRVSMAEDAPLWSFTHRYDDDVDLYWDKDIVGTGTITTDETEVRAELVNSTTSGHSVEYRTFRYFEYGKGRMQTFLFTCSPDGGVANTTKDWGAFDEDNGIFFRLNGTSPELIIRTKTSGSVVNNVISRTNWDDKMDGTGASGITLDFSKNQLWYISYAWLGANAVEWGIFTDGVKTPIHRYNVLNQFTVAYTQSGNLPLCFKVDNTGTPASAPKMYHTCAAIFNNGKQETLGEVFTVDAGTTEVSINTTEAVIAGIRMDPNKNQASIKPVNFSLISPSGNSTVYYRVVLGATLTSPTWTAIDKSIADELTGTMPTFSGGFTIQSGYIKAGGENVQANNILSNLYVGRKIDGTSQSLIIVASTVTSTAKILFSSTYREYK